MEIPIGRDYTFTIEVLQEGGLLPLNVTTYTGVFNIFDKSNNNTITTASLTPVVGGELKGLMVCTIDAIDTQGITVSQGSAADDYYVKATHGGFIYITDGTSPDRNVTIDEVVFIPTGY